MSIRVGMGFDSHAFSNSGTLLLGGVKIPDAPSLEGVSDADALFHAVADAILGAAGLGEIGELYPPEKWKGRGLKSNDVLASAVVLVREKGWEVSNLDCVIVCSRVKLKNYLPAMRENIARMLGTSPADVNVKVKSTEGMGLKEPSQGVMCLATVILRREE